MPREGLGAGGIDSVKLVRVAKRIVWSAVVVLVEAGRSERPSQVPPAERSRPERTGWSGEGCWARRVGSQRCQAAGVVGRARNSSRFEAMMLWSEDPGEREGEPDEEEREEGRGTDRL